MGIGTDSINKIEQKLEKNCKKKDKINDEKYGERMAIKWW